MTTIVVHGTMTVASAKHATWWWNSWSEQGFLGAMRQGMRDTAGWDDIWTVQRKPVEEIPELQPKWSPWKGRRGQVSAYKGRFIWSGADMGAARDAGTAQLVDYLNRIADLSDEPIRIVAHSHGCNLVKAATSHRKLRASINLAVFLACPHFVSEDHQGLVFTYRLNPERVDFVLNLFNNNDSVQTEYAAKITGIPGARLADWLPPTANRWDVDDRAQEKYENYEVTTAASGIQAHEVMHGSLLGRLCGMWFNSEQSFAQVVDGIGGLPAIPADDTGA